MGGFAPAYPNITHKDARLCVCARYTDDEGGARKWDRAVRTTKQSEASTDACVILAVLKHADGSEGVVVVKQFRPPVNAYTIELPAGLIDKGETVEQAAVRELKEECGCVHRSRNPSSPLAFNVLQAVLLDSPHTCTRNPTWR